MRNEVRKKNANKKNKIHYFVLKHWLICLTPDQMDSQVDASLDLRSACVSFGHQLASTCVVFGRAQIDASFLPFGHPAQVDTS